MPPRKKANGQTALPGMPTMADLRDTLWKAADKLRGSMDAAQYKDFVLGLVFIKYVSDSYEERRAQIRDEVLAEGVPETRLDTFLGDKDEHKSARDVLGEVYEYFLEKFAKAEGKRGGEFYTPASVVRLLVEVLEPYEGRVYDP